MHGILVIRYTSDHKQNVLICAHDTIAVRKLMTSTLICCKKHFCSLISIRFVFSFFETDVKSQSTAANIDGCGTGVENTYFGSLWARYHFSFANDQAAEGLGNYFAFVICF